MLYAFVRRALTPLKRTPLHPQWFVYRNEHKGLHEIASNLQGLVLDIGCADKRLQQYLPETCSYLGLDYYPIATERYKTSPDIFGDAQELPFADNSIDSVTLLDVLEHLPTPEKCLKEIARVIKPSGRFIIQVPFLYPIHDAPFDFGRWTLFGLRQALTEHGFTIIQERAYHQPAETAALLGNLALSKVAIESIERHHPATLLLPLLALTIPCINVLGWLLAKITPHDDFMPSGYRLIGVLSP